MLRQNYIDPENTKLVQDFNKLSDKEKENYIVGFKLGFNLYKMRDNPSIKYFITKIYNHKETSNLKVEKTINDKLISSFEDILKQCNKEQKKVLINSLESYIQFEKKYTESVDRLNELKKIISQNNQLNQHKNIFDAQVKFVKLAEFYKKNLDSSYSELNTKIQDIKKNIKVSSNSTPISVIEPEPVQPEPVIKSIPTKEQATPVVEQASPVVEEQATPVVEQTSPVVEQASPVVEEQSTPVVEEQATPVVEEQATPVVEEQASPVEEQASPVVEEQASPVVEEQASPVEEKPKRKRKPKKRRNKRSCY